MEKLCTNRIISIGHSQEYNSFEAGRECAINAFGQTGFTETPSLVLAFVGRHHDAWQFKKGLSALTGDAPVVGGGCPGVITGALVGASGYECAVGVLNRGIGKVEIALVRDLEKGEKDAGRALGRELSRLGCHKKNVLLFFDSIRSDGKGLNVASLLMEGLYQGLDGAEPAILGAGLVDQVELNSSWIFDGARKAKNTAVAVILPEKLVNRASIMHGCLPVSGFMEVTRAEGPVIYELDHKPAAQVLLDIIDEPFGPEAVRSLSLSLTLGEKRGDPFAPYDESAYVNRIIITADPENGSVTIFEADYAQGAMVQVMSRDNTTMLNSTRTRSADLMKELNPADDHFSIYIDCAGRMSSFSGAGEEEAGIVSRLVSKNSALLGFYSGVELAPFEGRTRPLDWTGVLGVYSLEGRL